jgi:hypothetical protein
MRWHPKGERYKGTLHDGTITIAEDVATPDEQQVEPDFRVNIGASREAESLNQPSTKDCSVQEFPVGDIPSMAEEIPDAMSDIPTSPIPVSSGAAFALRPRSSSI